MFARVSQLGLTIFKTTQESKRIHTTGDEPKIPQAFTQKTTIKQQKNKTDNCEFVWDAHK